MEPIDLKIVQVLDRNCRDSFSHVGSILDVTPRTVQRRVTRMLETGFIRSFEVMVDQSSLDLAEAVCDIKVKSNARNEDVRNRLLKIPNVNEVISLAGGTFVSYLHYRDSAELESILSRLGATVGVADVQYELSPRNREQPPRLSRQSWLLIHALNHKARREFADVAAEVGLSSRTVQRNIQWLRTTAAVRFGVDIDVSKAQELFIYVLVVRLQLGMAKSKLLEHLRNVVSNAWRELRTVNPHTIILLFYAKKTAEIERDVETVRLVNGVAGVRVLIITSDRRNTSLVDSRIAEKAGKRES
jgi:DNA-binding Lrp family transcriptional regulator